MNKYYLTLVMKDGSVKYDMTSATSKSIDQVQKEYDAHVKNELHSFKNVERVIVE